MPLTLSRPSSLHLFRRKKTQELKASQACEGASVSDSGDSIALSVRPHSCSFSPNVEDLGLGENIALPDHSSSVVDLGESVERFSQSRLSAFEDITPTPVVVIEPPSPVSESDLHPLYVPEVAEQVTPQNSQGQGVTLPSEPTPIPPELLASGFFDSQWYKYPPFWLFNPVAPDEMHYVPRKHFVHDVPELSCVMRGAPDKTRIGEWDRHVTRGDGRPFFYNSRLNVITEDLVTNDPAGEDYRRLMAFATAIVYLKHLEPDVIPQNAQAVVELYESTEEATSYPLIKKYRCYYYFVYAHNSTGRVFWLKDPNIPEVKLPIFEVMPPLDVYHAALALEREYWLHVYYYGSLKPQELSEEGWIEHLREGLRELGMMIATQNADLVTSQLTSTSLLSLQDLERWGKIVRQTLKGVDFYPHYASSILGKLKAHILHGRFVNCHETVYARTHRFDSIYKPKGGKTRSTSRMFACLSFVMFFLPKSRLESLENVYVDGTVTKEAWEHLLDKFKSGWKGHGGLSTILIAALFAFLDIDGIESGDLSQTFACIAISLAFGSLFSALCLLGLHDQLHHVVVDKVADFLNYERHQKWGFESLALTYCIPLAFLSWGFIVFVIAFCTYCLTTCSLPMRIVLCIIWGAIVLLLVWSLRISQRGWLAQILRPDALWGWTIRLYRSLHNLLTISPRTREDSLC